ncbi:MAG: hypothetical protein ABH869_05250, partial [Candidatus Omnitrophota bacterium]
KIIAGIVCIVLPLLMVGNVFNYTLQYRCVPLILIILIFMCLARGAFNEQRQVPDKNTVLLAMSLFSLILLLRVILKVEAGRYGFYLLVPGMLLYYVFFLKIVPQIIKYKNPVFSGALIIFFIFLAGDHFKVSDYIYSQKILEIGGNRGKLYFLNTSKENNCKKLIEYLQNNTKKDDTLVVFPEGAVINFFSERDNPLRYYQFLPQDLVREKVEDEVIRQLDEKNVDYIAIVQRSTAEYGYPVFGLHYAKKLKKWINDNYQNPTVFGAIPFTTRDYGVMLLERK